MLYVIPDCASICQTIRSRLNREFCFPATFGKVDLVLIAVRSEATKAVLDAMTNHMTDDAVVVSLQNGMNLPLVARSRRRGPRGRRGGAHAQHQNAPGHVRTYQNGYLYIGHIHGRRTPQLEVLHALLDPVDTD